MRKLLVLSTVFAFGLAAPASAATPVLAPGFEKSFPELRPLEPPPKDASAFGPDDRVLLAATFWVLLASVAIWRRGQQPERDPTPTVGWVLGYAPPLPR